jgi:hypothetical protein
VKEGCRRWPTEVRDLTQDLANELAGIATPRNQRYLADRRLRCSCSRSGPFRREGGCQAAAAKECDWLAGWLADLKRLVKAVCGAWFPRIASSRDMSITLSSCATLNGNRSRLTVAWMAAAKYRLGTTVFIFMLHSDLDDAARHRAAAGGGSL